jgi:glucose-1-phosphate adenylyltransferase
MQTLTEIRATAAMPVGSSYRAIDFPLSNMTNSGINKVAIITQYNSRSLHDHLSSPKWWGFGSKRGGMFVFSPFLSKNTNFWFRGTADSIYQNISFLRRSNEPYVVIAGGDAIYKMDYNDVMDFHLSKGADITVVCKDVQGMDVRNFGVVSLDDDKRLIEFEEKPLEAFSRIISLGIYVIKRELLIELLETLIPEGRYDFVRDVVVRYRKRLNIFGFMYDAYWAGINSVESYYNINMDFLRGDIRKAILYEQPFIETKSKDEPPAKYNVHAVVRNSLVGSGSIIDGQVENSILFQRVHVGEKTVVNHSIIMEGCKIGHGCIIENAILDKDVSVSDNRIIRGREGEPMIIQKNSVF